MTTKNEILKLVAEYASTPESTRFIPGETYLHAAKAYYDKHEILSLVNAALDMRWVDGEITRQFEQEMARFLGVRFAIMVNSGSSANLLALTALTSELFQSKRLRPGDEVITVAAGFPTTVNPIIQNGLIPVFIDTNVGTYNPTPHMVDVAITEKTKAIFIAHTLGNPYDIDEIKEIAKLHNLWVIEDCADCLGAEFDGRKCGTFGNISTTSFYPAHLMSVGEGGMVFTDSPMIAKAVRSFRDWGRSCWCAPGQSGVCGQRFTYETERLPEGWDHKYIFDDLGYNLKMTDLQAALGCQQLVDLQENVDKRRSNFKEISKEFYGEFFTLVDCDLNEHAWPGKCSPFGIPVLSNYFGMLQEVIEYLENNKIGTRRVFAGNITCQPGFMNRDYVTVGKLDVLWIICVILFFVWGDIIICAITIPTLCPHITSNFHKWIIIYLI